jgi:hypothetical protein
MLLQACRSADRLPRLGFFTQPLLWVSKVSDRTTFSNPAEVCIVLARRWRLFVFSAGRQALPFAVSNAFPYLRQSGTFMSFEIRVKHFKLTIQKTAFPFIGSKRILIIVSQTSRSL